jgi:hypothetical protein
MIDKDPSEREMPPPKGEPAIGPLRPETNFMQAVIRLFAIIADTLPDKLPEPVDVCIAGGVAVHALTGARVSDDVDTIFSHRVLVPKDLVVGWRDAQGFMRALCFDYNYSPVFGLLHPDYPERAIPLVWDSPKPLRLRVLAPVDLAISKLARFADQDRDDIRLLIARGLLTDAEQFSCLAEEALSYFVGDTRFLMHNLSEVCEWIKHHGKADA